jgi:hypothetical protein
MSVMSATTSTADYQSLLRRAVTSTSNALNCVSYFNFCRNAALRLRQRGSAASRGSTLSLSLHAGLDCGRCSGPAHHAQRGTQPNALRITAHALQIRIRIILFHLEQILAATPAAACSGQRKGRPRNLFHLEQKNAFGFAAGLSARDIPFLLQREHTFVARMEFA